MTAPASAGRYNPDDPALRYAVPVRHAALESATAGIRVRRGSRLPVEQILLGAAAILFPLGLVLVLLGWYGAAHNGHTYAQIDYLISGGLFGLGLSVAGGFLYFGYWLSRQLTESRRQSGLTLQSLQRIEDLLDGVLNTRLAGSAGVNSALAEPDRRYDGIPDGRPAGAAGSRRAARAGGRNGSGSRTAGDPYAAGLPATDPAAGIPTGQVPAVDDPLLLATPRGSLLHRPECPVVARRQDLRSVPAGAAGFGYCTMCDAAGVLA